MERLANVSSEKIQATEHAMISLLQESPEGIKLGDLYQELEDQGFSESIIRAAFLGLAQINAVDLTRDRRVVLVVQPSTI